MSRFNQVLVATDFGDPSAHALEVAMDLAQALDANLTLVHVYEMPTFAYAAVPYSAVDLLTPIEQAAKSQLDRTLAHVHARMPTAKAFLRRGVPWREILASIQESGADLVVLGTHGRRGLQRALLGSVAEKIVRVSPAAVLTVHDDGSTARTELAADSASS